MRKVPSITLGCLFAALLVGFSTNGCMVRKSIVLDFQPESIEETSTVPQYFWPLTGRVAPNGIITNRRPISMKIENSLEARPQSGLINADIVYEVEVEGGITRFHVLFQSDLPEIAGPLRSARSSDAWIVPQWDSYLLYSGSTEAVRADLENAGIDKIPEEVDARIWQRVDWRYAPHNLYVHIADVPDVIGDFGVTTDGWEARTLAFEDTLTNETPTVTSITVPFPAQTSIWRWDNVGRQFLRFQEEEAHTDRDSGIQIGAENVVVLWADYYDFASGGKATLFKNGVAHEGVWIAQAGQPPLIETLSGEVITYRTGKTWFEIVSPDTEIVVE